MQIYTAARGDTVYSIARQFGTTPSRIIADNLLADPERLAVGQDLVILEPELLHTVSGGETLSSIAARYGVTAGTLWRNNPFLGGGTFIYPGEVLNIAFPPPPFGEIEVSGYAYPWIDRDVLRRTLPYLSYLMVFSWGLRENGDLIEPDGADDLRLLARQYGAAPVLTLTSLTERGTFSSELVERILGDPVLSAAVSRNLASAVRDEGWGGVDFDFEYIPAQYAEAYADLVRDTREALGGSVPVFVSLAPKTSAGQEGLLYRGHDYGLLADASDDAFLMTYEWGYTYGPPMAVAPINEVRRVAEYALTEADGASYSLGYPNYGYDWALPYVRGESKARTLGYEEALRLALNKRAEILFDPQAASPYFTYWDRPETFEDAVEHIVWFENARSAEAKMRLVPEYGFSGIGVWNLMRFFPGLWVVLNQLFSVVKPG
ncbi:MAG: LysM peptidoglycan-binding domain-containing protein [Ruminococcaceae bacterium]|jgi:spore germination protein|nr:LysM peptidoglycan-binding domain-containing protein [Oscillospiraceae bacterium]